MQVIDFSHVSVGTLVKRSEHWKKECGYKARRRTEIGVITDFEFFQHGNRLVRWPVVHWENYTIASLTHPANVDFYRKTVAQMIDVDF